VTPFPHQDRAQAFGFARRTAWCLDKNALTQELVRLRETGQEILDLTESNPTRCDFPFSSQEFLNPLISAQNMSYDPCPRGIRPAREALCRYYADRGIELDPEQIFLTASTSEAYAFLFRLLADPGDAVLFPQPSYPLFDFLGGLNDVAVEYYPLTYTDGWRPDLGKLRTGLKPTTKAVVLVNPNNPTGSFIRQPDLTILAALCAERGIPIISDEVFHDYRLDSRLAPLTLLTYRDSLTFVLGGLSKALALPQMKLSWIVMNGPAASCRQAGERLEIIADTYLSASTPTQNALKSWLTLQPGVLKMILGRLRHNDMTLKRIFGTASRGQYLTTEGGWSAVVRLPRTCHEESFVLSLLEENHVLVYPGFFFDFTRQSVIVVSLLPPEDIFQEGIRRLREHIKVALG